MKKTFLLLIMALACFVTSYGQSTTTTEVADFQATDNFGNNCYYKIIDAANHYVQLWDGEKKISTTTYGYTYMSFTGNPSTYMKTPGAVGGFSGSVLNPITGETYYVKSICIVGGGGFANNSLSKVILPEGVESIVGRHAFLWSVLGGILVLPSTLRSVDEGTFSECFGLTDVIGLENTKLERIPYQMFDENVSFVGTWKFPPTLRFIGGRALSLNPNQHKITFPASLDTITVEFNSYSGTFNRSNSDGSSWEPGPNDYFKVVRSENPNPPVVFGSPETYTDDGRFLEIHKWNTGYCSVLDSLYVPVDASAAYNSKRGWQTYADKTFEEVKIGPHGYTSYYLENENFQVPAGCTAYIIKKVDHPAAGSVVGDAQVVAFAPGKIIPKQTGFILQGTAGKTIAYQANVSGVEENVTGNLLVGTATEQEISGAGFKYYLFGYGIKGQGFYHQTGRNGESIKLPAHRAGLKVSLTGTDYAPAKELIFNFEEATTNGISTVEQTAEPRTDVIYDLQGRRVKNPVNGIYIVNGKKVVISK